MSVLQWATINDQESSMPRDLRKVTTVAPRATRANTSRNPGKSNRTKARSKTFSLL